MGWTNRGIFRMKNAFLRGQNTPATFYLALVTETVVPTVDTNTLSDLAQIVVGNGYNNGGLAVARNAVDWESITEDDALNLVTAIIKDLTLTASGGSIPASGLGARYAVLTDDNATIASRDALFFWELAAVPVTVSNGQTVTLADFATTGIPA